MANGLVTKVFIDANVLLDLILKREQYHAAKELFDHIESGTMDGFISPSIVHLLAYWIRKSQGAEKVKPAIIQIIDHIKVVDVDHRIVMRALKSDMKDVEDALQYQAAIAHNMEIFVSNDKRLKKLASPALPVLKASEFVSILNKITPTTSTHS